MDRESMERQELEQYLWEIEKRRSIRSRFELVLRTYTILGLFIAVAGAFYFIFITLDLEMTGTQQVVLLLSGTGLLMSFASWLLLQLRRSQLEERARSLRQHIEMSEFVLKWSLFENSAKQILRALGESFNKYSIRDVIEKLVALEVLDEEDALTLDEAIRIRNMAVHGGDLIPSATLQRLSSRVDVILNKLSNSSESLPT